MTAQPAFDLDGFFPYRINVLASAVSRAWEGVYRPRFGLTIPEWRVLVHLSQAADVSVREVQARVDMDKVKVTRAVQRLQAAGLVAKAENRRDRRLVSLSLTAKGAETMAEIAPLARRFEADALSALSDEDRDALWRIIEALSPRHSDNQP